MSIRKRLFFTIILICVVPTLVLSLYNYSFFKTSWIKMNSIDLAYLNRMTQDSLDEVFLQIADQVHTWAENETGAIAISDPEAGNIWANDAAHETRFISSVFILNRSGKIVSVCQKTKEGDQNEFSNTVGNIFPNHEQLDLEFSSIKSWAPLTIGNKTVATVIVSMPILDEDEEESLGWIVALLDAKKIESILQLELRELIARNFDSGIVGILDKNGNTLLMVDQQSLTIKSFDLPQKLSPQIKFNQEKWFVARSNIVFGENEFQIVQFVSESNLLNTTNELLTTTSLVYLGALFLIFIFVLILARALSNPIISLTKQAEGFGAGDYKSSITIQSKDEIGRLASILDSARKNIASYVNELEVSKTKIEELARSFERFVPKEFLRSLDKNSVQDVDIGDTISKNVTVFFSDIRNFTSISEKMDANEVFLFLNDLFQSITPAITENNGFIDKFIGGEQLWHFLSGKIQMKPCEPQLK